MQWFVMIKHFTEYDAYHLGVVRGYIVGKGGTPRTELLRTPPGMAVGLHSAWWHTEKWLLDAVGGGPLYPFTIFKRKVVAGGLAGLADNV